MPLNFCPCKSLCSPICSLSPLRHIGVFSNTFNNKPWKNPTKLKSPTTTPQNYFRFTFKFSILGATHVAFCSRNEDSDGSSSNQLSQEALDEGIQEHGILELLNKPFPVSVKNGLSSEVDKDFEKASTEEEALAPFMKFFEENGSVKEVEEAAEGRDDVNDKNGEAEELNNAEYYEPKPGDFVMGVVVSGNENKLNVNVGAELLGTMLTKEVLPLYSKELEYLLWDMKNSEENFMVEGRMRIVKNDDVSGVVPAVPGMGSSTVVEIGTVLFAEVLGRTLTGRPLLSSRRLFRRVAWHRLRQLKQLNEPIEVRITEWNAGGLLTRIEGLRAFLPKAELMRRVNSFTELKENVGRQMYVQITRVDPAKSDLIVSEREAWEKLYLREGTLLEGTVKKILPYGAQIRIGETNRCGLLHVSNITRAEITSVSDILFVDEKVKVLVVKSVTPDKISLSIADLESEPGLFLSNKEKVFMEADMMAKKYKEKLRSAQITTQPSEPIPTRVLPFENEALYANWKWLKFVK